MIKEHCFTEEWLERFKKLKDHKRIDKNILEKMIYALHLLECLKANGLDFVFKGGTSLVLLLEEYNRFSIDIDIICKTDRKSLETVLNKVVETSRFNTFELEEHRSYKSGVPKAHYKFFFDTVRTGSGNILLDILIDDSIYPKHTKIPLQTRWIETDGETSISVPTIDAITGDKLTAFAPNTIGIPYFKGKDKQSFSMEICKQLFDLSKLFEQIQNLEVVSASFQAFALKEIDYRRNRTPDFDLTPENVLKDIIDTSLVIAKKGNGSADEKWKFNELQRGIKAFGSGFLMSGKFRIDDAIPAAARVAYMAARLLVNDLTPIEYYNKHDVKEINIEKPEWKFLNRLKRQPDKSSFYYWYQTIPLLTQLENDTTTPAH